MGITNKLTAPEALFANVLPMGQDRSLADIMFALLVKTKGYEQVHSLAQQGILGNLVIQLIFQFLNTQELSTDIINYFGKRLPNNSRGHDFSPYFGRPDQNAAFDKLYGTARGPRVVGTGAAQFLNVPRNLIKNLNAGNIKIAIIGGGAAGIMMGRALQLLGFSKITIFEKKHNLGIWAQPNVAKGSKNNPRTLTFNDVAALNAAPGAGADVVNFLNRVAAISDNYVTARRELVKSIAQKGNEYKIVTDKHKHDEHDLFDIVVNCIGLGKPKTPLNTAYDDKPYGIRWQLPTLTADHVRGRRFVFVGLGNSTAEMLRTLHVFQDAGVDCDYRVVTHMNDEAIHNPDTPVLGNDFDGDSQIQRVFRDLSQPNLTAYQGDLEHSRNDYFRALLNGKIISEVDGINSTWSIKGKKFGINHSGKEFDFDQLYTLIGYQHSEETFEQMGIRIQTRGVRNEAQYDYDGEFIKSRVDYGRTTDAGKRLHKGYFGMGAVLETSLNKNAIVIPGMMFRLPLTLFGIIMRAYDIDARKRKAAAPAVQLELSELES
jgi:NADPH-dependent glutamate synthase beta subunit-like oxidoreductase